MKTCATCRYYRPSMNYLQVLQYGYCLRIHDEVFGLGDAGNDEELALILVSGEDMGSELSVRETFGCVLHEEKE